MCVCVCVLQVFRYHLYRHTLYLFPFFLDGHYHSLERNRIWFPPFLSLIECFSRQLNLFSHRFENSSLIAISIHLRAEPFSLPTVIKLHCTCPLHEQTSLSFSRYVCHQSAHLFVSFQVRFSCRNSDQFFSLITPPLSLFVRRVTKKLLLHML